MPYQDWSTYPGHSGIDWGQPEGTPIQASGAGVINYAGYMNERAGYGVTLAYDAFPGVEFLYCHQPKNGVRPKSGSRFVNLGYLGSVGNTGIRSTGPHLHVEVSIGRGAHTADGVWLYFNKNDWIGKASPAGGGGKPFKAEELSVEIVMVVPSGVIVHITNGVKYDFKSIEEYNRFRDDVALFNKKKSGKMMELPASQDVVQVEWDTYNRFCEYYGVKP